MKVVVGFGENLEQSSPLITAGHEVISGRGRSNLELAELYTELDGVMDREHPRRGRGSQVLPGAHSNWTCLVARTAALPLQRTLALRGLVGSSAALGLVSLGRGAGSLWKEATPEEKSMLVALLIERVYLDAQTKRVGAISLSGRYSQEL